MFEAALCSNTCTHHSRPRAVSIDLEYIDEGRSTDMVKEVLERFPKLLPMKPA